MGGYAAAAMAATQIYGAYEQSKAIKQKARFDENQARFNARMADIQAEDALRRGDRDAGRVRRAGKAFRGAQRAALAGQGVDVNLGTAFDLQEDTKRLNEEDVMTVKNNAWREAFGYKVQSQDFLNAAKFSKLSSRTDARNTILTGAFGGASSGLNYYNSSRRT